MRLKLQRLLEVGATMVGQAYSEEPGARFDALSIERAWVDNRPNVSCVPAGFYYLEPHNGAKYKDTFALIGAHVSHISEPGVQRSACVVHKARTGLDLEGCLSFGTLVTLEASRPPLAVIKDSKVDALLELLRSLPGPHYLDILDPPGLETAAWVP
jgi:hypothetical protein